MNKQHCLISIIGILLLFIISISASQQILVQNSSGEKQDVSQIDLDDRLVNTALYLDGNQSYVDIEHSLELNNITQQLTVSLWIKPTDIANRYSSLLAKTDKWVDGITHRSYVLNFKEGGYIQFAASPDSTNEASLYSPPDVIKLNKWHHVAGVIDPRNNSMKLYINGVEVGKRDFKGRRRLHRSHLPLRIGWSHEDRPAVSPFVGYIDEVRIWNIVRAGADIRRDMNRQLKGNERGLVSYWKLDKVTNGVISDSTQNISNGNFVGNAKLTGYVRPVSTNATPEQLENTATAYENLLTQETKIYDVYRNLAEIYIKNNRKSDAEKVYLRALKSNLTQNEHEDAIQILQKLYYERDVVNEFITILEELTPNMNNSHILYEILGDAYKSVGNEEKANSAYTQWLNMRLKEVSEHKHASDYHLLAEDLLDKHLFPDTALNMAIKAIEMHSGTSYQMTYIHAILMNEMYEDSFQLINNFLFSGYHEYTERSLFSRIVKTGKNVKDRDGYVEMLNNLIDAMPIDKADQLNTMLTLAQFYKENDMHENANKLIQQTGFVMEDAWMILGPFDNAGGIGYNTPYIPENLPKIDIEANYDGLNEQVSWKKYSDDILNGYIHFDNHDNWSVAYAYTTVFSPGERKVQFRFDSNDQGKIWINGIEVHSHTRTYATEIDREIVYVTLNPGKNSILVKVCEEYKGSGFYLRITDKDGKPFDDLEYITTNEIQ